ncbi:MAG: hypothetical protein RL497_1452 [Pseudomonadota bacterium]|jgi:hypothetical protein
MGRLRVTKNKKPVGKKKTPTAQETFAKLWKQVQNEQRLLGQLSDQIQDFYGVYKALCGPQEELWCRLQHEEVELLLTHWPRKSLSGMDRLRLGQYIIYTVTELYENPFRTIDVKELMLKAQSILMGDGALNSAEDDNPFGEKSTNKNRNSEADKEQNFFDEDDEDEDFFADDEFEQFFQKEFESGQKASNEAANELFNASSLNKMFRQLSKVLHPDLEQDEEQKIIKHELMAQLLTARDKHDAGTIITLYSQHIGGDGAQFSAEDFPRISALLKKQLRDLQFEKVQMTQQSGVAGFIYAHYHHKNSTRQKNLLRERQAVLEQFCDETSHSLTTNKTLKNLKQYLMAWESEQMAELLFDMY